MYGLLRNLLFKLEPEQAHEITLNALAFLNRWSFLNAYPQPKKKLLEVMGIQFPNPVGISAGLDKNAEYLGALGKLGFGFIEVGTVTPRAQPGNPKPRMFRYPNVNAIINRMGFNNKGIDHLLEKVQEAKYKGVLGISVSQNTHTPFNQAIDEYILGFQKAYPYAHYIAINISCPNVKTEERLDRGGNFDLLLEALKTEQQIFTKQFGRYVPIVVKVSPDLNPEDLENTAYSLLKYQVDGVIATNTTLQRACVEEWGDMPEQGGLSGAPLFALSLAVVKQLKHLLKDNIPIIASGGIVSVENSQQMFAAGASLVQLYSGLVFRGPKLLRKIVKAYQLT